MANVYADLIIKGKRKLSDVNPESMREKVKVILIDKYVDLIHKYELTIDEVPDELIEDIKTSLGYITTKD
jgi:hypothetical protein